MQCGEKRPPRRGRRYNGARWLRFSPAFAGQKGNDTGISSLVPDDGSGGLYRHNHVSRGFALDCRDPVGA